MFKSCALLIVTITFAISMHFRIASPQSIEGNVHSSGEYPRVPAVGALVDVGGLGQDIVDNFGYYHVPPLGIPPWIVDPLWERERITVGDLYNIGGQRVGRLSGNQTIEDILQKANLAAGRYFLRNDDDFGVFTQMFVVNGWDVVGKGKKSYDYKYAINYPVLDGGNFKGNTRVLNTEYIFTVDDDEIIGEIGDFYNYVDTVDVSGAESKDVRLIPRFYIGSQYYDELLDLMNDLEQPMGSPYPPYLTNYEDYPNNPITPYPQRVFLDSVQAYQYCTNPQLYLDMGRTVIDSINTKTNLDLFREVSDPDSANIFLNYTLSGGSSFAPHFEEIGGQWYFVGGTVYLQNTITNPRTHYIIFGHELGIHGLGMEGHSDDPNHISHNPILVWDFAPEEITAIRNHVLQYNNTWMYRFIEE